MFTKEESRQNSDFRVLPASDHGTAWYAGALGMPSQVSEAEDTATRGGCPPTAQ